MRAVIGLLALVTIAACRGGGTVDFPSRQLTYLVTFDPGGQSDREARRQQPLLQQYLGRTVVIDYQGGRWRGPRVVRSGALQARRLSPRGDQHTARHPATAPAGHRLRNHAAAPGRDPSTHAGRAGGRGQQSIQNARRLRHDRDSARNNVDWWLRHADGAASGGRASQSADRRETTYVPFSGSAPAITAFLGGRAIANFAFSDDLIRFRDRIRVLAIATEARFAGFPDVPTFRELGIDLVESVERGVAVPKARPTPFPKRGRFSPDRERPGHSAVSSARRVRAAGDDER